MSEMICFSCSIRFVEEETKSVFLTKLKMAALKCLELTRLIYWSCHDPSNSRSNKKKVLHWKLSLLAQKNLGYRSKLNLALVCLNKVLFLSVWNPFISISTIHYIYNVKTCKRHRILEKRSLREWDYNAFGSMCCLYMLFEKKKS